MRKTLANYFMWVFRRDWTLIELELTDYSGQLPTLFRPYAVETWQHDATGEIKQVYVL